MSPTATDGKVCRDCKWFDGSNCHRYPPQMVPWPNDNQHPVIYNPMATFPFVVPNNWCGEWIKSK
jgi:hypothetical protein